MGWKAILNGPVSVPSRAGIFKIPHHGSENADEPKVWEELLVAEPVATLTPYANSDLPKAKDIARICGRTPNAYITSDAAPTARVRPLPVQTMIDGVTNYLSSAEAPTGHVRARASRGDGQWAIELFGPAARLCP
jgi:hypothetical protein